MIIRMLRPFAWVLIAWSCLLASFQVVAEPIDRREKLTLEWDSVVLNSGQDRLVASCGPGTSDINWKIVVQGTYPVGEGNALYYSEVVCARKGDILPIGQNIYRVERITPGEIDRFGNCNAKVEMQLATELPSNIGTIEGRFTFPFDVSVEQDSTLLRAGETELGGRLLRARFIEGENGNPKVHVRVMGRGRNQNEGVLPLLPTPPQILKEGDWLKISGHAYPIVNIVRPNRDKRIAGWFEVGSDARQIEIPPHETRNPKDDPPPPESITIDDPHQFWFLGQQLTVACAGSDNLSRTLVFAGDYEIAPGSARMRYWFHLKDVTKGSVLPFGHAIYRVADIPRTSAVSLNRIDNPQDGISVTHDAYVLPLRLASEGLNSDPGYPSYFNNTVFYSFYGGDKKDKSPTVQIQPINHLMKRLHWPLIKDGTQQVAHIGDWLQFGEYEFRVVNIVPPDPEQKIAGWFELDKDPKLVGATTNEKAE